MRLALVGTPVVVEALILDVAEAGNCLLDSFEYILGQQVGVSLLQTKQPSVEQDGGGLQPLEGVGVH